MIFSLKDVIMSLARREFLGAGSAAIVSLGGGCSAISGSNEEPELLQLGVVGYANFDDSAHTLELIVSIEGEVKYWRRLDLASVEYSQSKHTNGTLDLSLPSKPVEYTVIARLNGTQTAQTTSATGIEWANRSNTVTEPHCARVRVLISKSAELEVENWEAKQSHCDR